MKRGQVFVRGLKANGQYGSIDVLDLDDASFRAFIVDALFRIRAVSGHHEEDVDGDDVEYREAFRVKSDA